MRGGTAYPLPPSAPLTGETGFSSSLIDPWPTPSTFDAVAMKGAETPEQWAERDAACAARGVRKQYPLTVAAKTGMSEGQFKREWPTPEALNHGGYQRMGNMIYPRLGSMVKGMWPTPRAEFDSGRHKGCQPDTLHSASKASDAGILSPAWVEQLMGFPDGWTDIGPRAPAKHSTTGRPRGSRKASSKGQPG